MTTRLRPTPTGPVHAGHILVADYNCRLAHRAGDPFLLVVDDICYGLQDVWKRQAYPSIVVRGLVEDLAWLGMEPDEVYFSSTNAEAHAEAAERLGFEKPGRVTNESFDLRCIRDSGRTVADQYHEWLVLTRVVDDHEWGVQAFARGHDLIGERQLYHHLWRQLYPAGDPPAQVYLPTVRRAPSPLKESTGAPTIRDLRTAGYTPEEVLGTIRECARVSALAGLADVVIPEGVLEVATHKPLEWQGDKINLLAHLKLTADMPQAEHVARQIARHLKGGNPQ